MEEPDAHKIQRLWVEVTDEGKRIVSNNAVMPSFLEHPSYDNMVTPLLEQPLLMQ